ncbi:aminopeptidase P family protein [Vibrio gallicus]|uniref:aminopeptidase P family protein n=1 Tax=Vibrio gallicus TaxID=190897 RepID=UPI0021C28E05|nr:aminopeptidase P family protein [Vibrio gallicus]
MLDQIESRVEALRTWLQQSNLDAFIIPHEDEFLGEYVPEHHERLYWISNFTGSAGATVITKDKAAIFVDGRYTVQVTKQTPESIFEYQHLIETPPLEWALSKLKQGSKIGFDPKMHSGAWFNRAQQKLDGQLQLEAVESNPIDTLWQDRPSPSVEQVRLMGVDWVGKTSQDKRKQIGKVIADQSADFAVITALDSIAWLLNIRGTDVSRLPVVLSHVIIDNSGNVDLFLDSTRLSDNFAEHVGSGVNVLPTDELNVGLNKLQNKKVILDANNSNAWFGLTLEQAGAEVIDSADPCLLPKALKNSTEAAGMRQSHIRDGVAMVRFLTWFDEQNAQGNLLDEGMVSDKLESFRRLDDSLVDLSFDTISAAAQNAAMCHYNHINEPKPATLSDNSMYLVDSGGQYPDGTTDITRTIAVGTPTTEMKRLFTLVLKGHISLATARFPLGTCGYQLDALARQHLWQHGFDFDHGTGHGVGHFLSVHEGPQGISKNPNKVALQKGMVVSNEPGYYRENQFGIRIENLEIVVEVETQGDIQILGFESLTRCPIDVRNIDLTLLNSTEVEWLNQYHSKVRTTLDNLLDEKEQAWLINATAPIELA